MKLSRNQCRENLSLNLGRKPFLKINRLQQAKLNNKYK